MLKRTLASITVLACFALSFTALNAAAEKSSVDQVIDMLFRVREFRQVAISLDATKVAWVETLNGPNGEPTADSAIYVQDLHSPAAKPLRIGAGDGSRNCTERDVSWSPDSRHLAFLSDKESKGQLQLYLTEVSEAPAKRHHIQGEMNVGTHRLSKGFPKKLTSLTGSLDNPRWSPDGKTLAILFIENAPRVPGPLEPMTPPSGLIEQQAYEQRLATVDVASGRVRQISPADLYVYEYDWSPDGKRFAAIAAHGAGDANWYIAELYTLDATSGTMRSIYKPGIQTQIAVPRWSPDGQSIAFIGGLMSDEGNTGGDIFAIPAGGGQARNLTPGIQASASWLAWTAPQSILFSEWIDGQSGLATVNPISIKIETLWKAEQSNSTGGWSFGVSPAADGRTCALVLQSFEQPPEVWCGPIGAWKQVTHRNQDIHAEWGKSQSLRWTNEGMPVQGWLTYPRDYDPSRRYPLVVEVHGGPGSMKRPSFPQTFFDFALLSHEGYFVLYPNPRGSFGQGEAFTTANVKDFGYGDFRDILAGVDQVLKTAAVDTNRVGIGGWSYGGFMTMWAVTQTNRFRAAVAGAGIANWQSYYGENDIDRWMIPFFGASVYDNPAVYAKSSPITFIKNVNTPTLILVGDRDGECPVPQSFEFWHALKTLGVENQFVVYPNEGHNISRPEHRRDITKRVIAWYNQHLK